MYTLLVTLVVFLLAFIAMTVGVLLGRSSIKGSCGGANQCGSCQRPCDKKRGDNNVNTVDRCERLHEH